MAANSAGPEAVEPNSLRTRLSRALLEELPFLSLVLAYAVTALVLHRVVGIPIDFNLNVSWELIAVWTALYSMPAVLGFLVYSVVSKDRSLFDSDTWLRLLRWFLNPAHTAGFLLVFLSLPFFMSVFVAFKASIPAVQPFAWDIRFMEWDRVLHLGSHPWRILQPIVGYPVVTAWIDLAYYLWFPVLWMTVIWQAWHGDRDSETRTQFLVTFASCWILLGTISAILFSSAGPVYFGAVTQAPDPYAPLMDYLNAVNVQDSLRAIWAQDVLWTAYTDPTATQVEGISAMPSLHVSMAVLLTLLGFPGQAMAWHSLCRFRVPDHDRFRSPGLALRNRWLRRCSGYAGNLVGERRRCSFLATTPGWLRTRFVAACTGTHPSWW